jgi:hypothetical protein
LSGIVVNIADLLERPGGDRAKWLREEAELKLSSADALAKAKNADEVMNALAKKVSRYTPRVVPANPGIGGIDALVAPLALAATLVLIVGTAFLYQLTGFVAELMRPVPEFTFTASR